MNSINLKENRAELVETMEAILDTAKSENRDLTKDESNTWEGFDTEIKALDKKIAIAERQEQLNKSIAVNMSVQTDQEAASKEMKSWSLFKAVKDIQKGGLTGVEAEMHKEAENENRSSMSGIGIPTFMTKAEKRAVIDQGNSAIQPASVNAFADGLLADSLYDKVGLNNLGTLAADTIVPITGANVPTWAGENAAASDVGNDFTKVTLQPNRITGYADLSNQILIQNGTGAEAAIMRDMGRQIGKKIDTNMFATADEAAGPGSICGTSGVLTFTEAASVDVASDLLEAVQTLANDHGLLGNNRFVISYELYSLIQKAAQVSNTTPLIVDGKVLGFDAHFSASCTAVAGTSGDGMFGDFSRVYFAQFGPTNILVDPYSASGNGAVRLMVNQYYDFKLASGASFVKFTSLSA